jgi:hypothetical protein
MLVIVVGGIPIAMPTVLSVTLALGASALAKEGAIVARMSAVEEMAGTDILCSDKTGARAPVLAHVKAHIREGDGRHRHPLLRHDGRALAAPRLFRHTAGAHEKRGRCCAHLFLAHSSAS